jgi:predicted MFS family arabinose efflux permease
VLPSSLWRNRDFLKLWVGQTASQFGSQAGQVTLPLVAVVALGAEAGQLGELRAAQQIPVLLLSLFVGVWVDRWRVRTVMVLADLARALVLMAIPIAYLFGALGVPLLFAVAFVVGVFTVCFDVAYQASLVRLVDRDELARGASILESSRSLAQIGGPALGGSLVSLLSAPLAIIAGAVFFALSSVSISRIHRSEVPDHGGRAHGVLRSIREGLSVVARDPSLRTVGVISGIFQFSFAAFMTIYLVFLPRTLELSGAAIGLTLAALGPGALVGSLLAATLPRRLGYGPVLVTAAAIADAALIGVPLLHGSGAVTIVLLVTINFTFGVFGQTVDVCVVVVRQTITPLHLQGRVAATINFATLGLAPIGSLTGGYLATHLNPRTALLITALALLSSPTCMLLSPLARLGRTVPAAS